MEQQLYKEIVIYADNKYKLVIFRDKLDIFNLSLVRINVQVLVWGVVRRETDKEIGGGRERDRERGEKRER